MNAEQLHEIYDNNGTLIGYETIEADAATGRFTRYDEHMMVLGYAKDAGDLIYHYDRSMRFIGYARMEDDVLREYDLNSNIVGYQSRSASDMPAPLANDPQDQRQAPPNAFSFTDSTPSFGGDNGNGSGNGNEGDTGQGNPGGPSQIYAASKSYSFTGSDWFGASKGNNSRDNKSSQDDSDDHEADELDIDVVEPQTTGIPDAFSNRFNTNGAFANSQNDSHYDGPSTFDFHAPQAAGNAFGDAYEDGAHDASNNPNEQAYPWEPQYTNKGPRYAVRGEIVDDVDEFGNEINPADRAPEPMSSSQQPQSQSRFQSQAQAQSQFQSQSQPQSQSTAYAQGNYDYAAAAYPSNNEPMARPSRFAKKPSLLQRLISRVMPFASAKSTPPTAPMRRAGFAALPAPEGATEPAPNDAPSAWPPQQAAYARAGYGQTYGEIDPDSLGDEDEKFDPLAEMKLLWQKINYYAQQILPRRKPREDDTSLFDLRDSLAADAPPVDPFNQGSADNGADNGAAFGANSYDIPAERENHEPATPESALGSASESSFAEAPSLKWQPRNTILALQAFLMAIPAQLAPLPVRLMKAALRAIQTPQWLWWMTATALGTIAFGMVRLFIPPIGDIPAWIYTGLYGLMIGVSQWAMLRHRYRTTWHWVIVSTLAGIASALLSTGELGWLHGRTKAAPLDEIFTLYFMIGSMQWLLLRNLSNRSIAWLILTPLAAIAGWLGYNLGTAGGYIAALSVHGLAIGAVSGFALAPVIEERSPKAIFQLPSTANIVGLVAMLTGGIRALSAAIALGGLLEAVSGSMSAVTQGGAAQQTPMLLALLSVYPARLFVSLTTMGSALSFRQSESNTSRGWLVGAAIVGILIEVIAQAVLPEMARPSGGVFFIAANLVVLLLIDALTPPTPATEASAHTTLISLSAIGMLASGLLIFFGSIFLAAHSINIDLMATASMTASEIGFSLSMATLLSLLRVGLSAFAIFVALRLPGERSNGWADVPMGILAIGAATFVPMLLESNNSNNDLYWLAPIALASTALVMGLLRNAAAFGGPLPVKSKDDESTVRNAPRLVPVGLLICALSVGVVLTRNGAWETLRQDPRVGVVTAKVQDLTSGVTAKIKQLKLPKSMDEVQQSTSGLQKTVSGIMTQLEPTPEPTADWPPASK